MDFRVIALNYAACGVGFAVLIGWWWSHEKGQLLPLAVYPLLVLIWLPVVVVMLAVLAWFEVGHRWQLARIRFELWQLRWTLWRVKRKAGAPR